MESWTSTNYFLNSTSSYVTTLLCLISVGHTNSQLLTLYFDYNLKWPTIISIVKILIWAFSFSYLNGILIFIQLYFAIFLNKKCTSTRNVGKLSYKNKKHNFIIGVYILGNVTNLEVELPFTKRPSSNI